MFIKAPYVQGKSNLVAFNPDSLTVERIPRYYTSGFPDGSHRASIEGIWFSKSSSSLGALVYGSVNYIVGDGLAGDNLQMNYSQFLHSARTKMHGRNRYEVHPLNEQVDFFSYIVLSETKIWGASGSGELERAEKAIHIFRTLPELPKGWDGWYKLSNQRD